MMSNHFSNDATPKAYAKNQVNEVWPIEKVLVSTLPTTMAYIVVAR